MAQFERAKRGSGEIDPGEALRRAQEAVARERAARAEQRPPDAADDEVTRAEEAFREQERRHEG